MITGRERIANALRAFSDAHPTWVLFDETSETLFEVSSGRTLKLPVKEIAGVVERKNAVTGEPYLFVERGDGRELALSEVGFAFPPVIPNVPQAPQMPRVVCMRDFETLRVKLEHDLRSQPDGRPTREMLDAVALCIGILDGGRVIGLDISRDERALEALVTELEKRR